MTILFEELKENLKKWDETSILELLDIHSDELVERFEDVIEQRYNYIIAEIYEDEETVDWKERTD